MVLKGEAPGRQAAGRHRRLRQPRDRDRVPARRHPREHHGGHLRADAEPGRPRARPPRGREVDAGQRRRHDDRPRRGAEGRGSGAGRAGGCDRAAPAEPEVIKKGKTEKDDEKREVASTRSAMKLIVGLGIPAREVPGHPAQRRLRGRRSAWRSGTGWRGDAAPADALVARWRPRRRAAGEAADVHEPERPRGRRAAAVLQDRPRRHAGRRRRGQSRPGAAAGAAWAPPAGTTG